MVNLWPKLLVNEDYNYDNGRIFVIWVTNLQEEQDYNDHVLIIIYFITILQYLTNSINKINVLI